MIENFNNRPTCEVVTFKMSDDLTTSIYSYWHANKHELLCGIT